MARPSRVVDFSLIRPKLCDTCINAYFGQGGIYCRAYNVDIWNPEEAEDCELWEE